MKREGPQFFDTHCHLDTLKAFSLEEILEKGRQNGVNKFVTVAAEPSHLEKVVVLAGENNEVFCTQGIHPHEASLFNEEVKARILANVKKEKKVVAIGEIGLDYHYDHSPRDIQKTVFEEQLQLSLDVNLPLVIHTREADQDTMGILKNFLPSLKKKGLAAVIHSFTGSRELAEYAIGEGMFLGFNGIITFKKAQDLRDILLLTPTSQLLFETDAPYLTPEPFRGRENGPYHLPLVAERAAQVKGLTGEDRDNFWAEVYQNSLRFFGLP